MKKNFEKLKNDFQEFTKDSENEKILNFFEYLPEKKV